MARASGRLEDVFQDEVINEFYNLTEFKMFARSESGLQLKESDIEQILDDNTSSVDKKLAMLNKWKTKKGSNATVSEIRCRVEGYRKRDRKDYVSLHGGMFGMYKNEHLCKKGHVCRGEQKSGIAASQPRAIKMLPYTERNLREAKILMELGDHDNVVSVKHVDEYRSGDFDYIYIVMELVSTMNLRDVFQQYQRQGAPFNELLAMDMAMQLVKGLAFIHAKKFLHRDLKPENILVSENKKNIKITDFGISKSLNEDDFLTSQTNESIGTYGYRAPETYEKQSKISSKTDIFSAGVVIAEILSNGKHPYGDDNSLWSHNIINNKGLDLQRLLILNRPPVEQLIRQMLHTYPDNRPSAEVVLSSILRLRGMMQPAASVTEVIDQMPSIKRQPPSRKQKASAKESIQRTTDTAPSATKPRSDGNQQLSGPPSGTTTKTVDAIQIADAILMFTRLYMYSYQPKGEEWSQLRAFEEIKESGIDIYSTALIDQHVYFLNEKNVLQLEYSNPTAEWISVATLIKPHGWWPPAVAFKDSVYVCGSSDEASQSVERYERRRNAWAEVPSLNVPRKRPCVVATKDHLYCIGGEDPDKEKLKSVERFDGNKWETVEDSPKAIIDATAAVLGEQLYVADAAGVQCYNIKKNSWRNVDLSKQWPFKKLHPVKILTVKNDLFLIGAYDFEKYGIYLLDSRTQIKLVKTITDKNVCVGGSIATNTF